MGSEGIRMNIEGYKFKEIINEASTDLDELIIHLSAIVNEIGRAHV